MIGIIGIILCFLGVISKEAKENQMSIHGRELAKTNNNLYYIDGSGHTRLTSTNQVIIVSKKLNGDYFRKYIFDTNGNIIMCIDWEYLKDLNKTVKSYCKNNGYKGYVEYTEPRNWKDKNYIEFETERKYKIRPGIDCVAYITYLDGYGEKTKKIFSLEEYKSYALNIGFPKEFSNIQKKWCFN